MGRPRKRRREDEADVPPEQTTTAQTGYDSSLNGFIAQPSFGGFDLVSPLEFSDLSSAVEVYAQTQLDPSLVGTYGPSPPITNNE